MLALAIGLKSAGHEAVIASGECFREECSAFGIPFVRAGVDVRKFIEDQGKRGSFTPLRATTELLKVGRREVARLVDELIAPSREADVIIGAGAQIGAPTAAEVAGKPYWFMAYTPQLIPSSFHPPFTIPIMGLPRLANRGLWAGRCLLACDPELSPPPPDLKLFCPPIGSFHLTDERPLPRDLDLFLRGGSPPVYIGFGSMPDQDAGATTRLILEAVKQVGCRAIVSSGWAGLGGMEVPPHVRVVGPISHTILFPRVAATVHHGGAGTSAASARAGIPQLVVHHAFDQIGIGQQVERAGVGPAPVARAALTSAKLAVALRHLLQSTELARTASALGDTIRQRDPVKAVLGMLDRLAGSRLSLP